MSGQLDLERLAAGVEAGRRAELGQAITLVESTRPADRSAADALVERLRPASGQATRVAITGAPGVGKSTLIEALGLQLIERGHKVAVLAVDPSSMRTGGSILGDKTRMGRLARQANAFIRPSPSAGTLGGVARRTRETIVVCEAAGFDTVLVETVGVGQSEAVVADMVDFLMVLVLAGSGDALQGIKRGILELADLVTITKADGDNVQRAAKTARQYRQALGLIPPKHEGWHPPVTECSAQTGTGLLELWDAVERHRAQMQRTGAWEANRRNQRKRWMWEALRAGLVDALQSDPGVVQQITGLQEAVEQGTLGPERAAQQILAAFLGRTDD